jgi:hypothetical protein
MQAHDALHNVSHVSLLSDLTIFGLPFAMMTSLMLFCTTAADVFGLNVLRYGRSTNSWRDPRTLSSAFGWILVATILTNGYIGIPSMGSVVLVIAIWPLLQWLGQDAASTAVSPKRNPVANAY